MTASWRLPHFVAMATTVAAIFIFFLPTPEAAPNGVMRTAGVIVFIVGLWATAVLPEYLTSIIFFTLAGLLALAPPNIVFSAFHSSAVWIVFGGLVIGVAVQSTGLGARMARGVSGWFPGSYTAILAGIVILSAMMSFLLPSSTGRVMVMLPIILAFADRLGFDAESNGRAGMALAMCAGTLYPAFGVLPANVPNLGLVGAAESVYKIRIPYVDYMIVHFPVIATVSLVALPLILRALFPDKPRVQRVEQNTTRVTRDEWFLMIVLAAALGLWMTDFLHGISPAWVAMGAAVLCLLPRIGVLPPTTVVEKLNYGPWLFVAGVIGMGAVVNSTGLGDLLGRVVFSVIEFSPGEDARNFASVAATGMGIGLMVGMPGQPAIMSALAPAIAEGTGWPFLTALMAQAPSWSMALFPYQFPPFVLVMYLADLKMSRIVPFLICIMVLSWVVILPLEYLWWRYLGLFG